MQSLLLLSIVLEVLFAVAPASPPPATQPGLGPLEGAPIVDWREAPTLVGHPAIVQGRIVSTKNIGHICFLNFDATRARTFTGVIFFNDFHAFPDKPEEVYRDQWVRLRGTITTYGGNAQINLFSPDQIEILDGEPPQAKPIAPRAARSSPVAPERITIASFNILNLFDAYDDPYHEDEGTRIKPRDELNRVAAMIRQLDADVLALQEIESRGYLERFVRVLLSGLGYSHVVHLEGNDLRGIDCAVLSRWPVGPVTSYRHVEFEGPGDKPMRFRRDLLRVRILPPGADGLDVFVVHLKSKGGGKPSDAVRLAEARQLRKVLDDCLETSPEARFVVCGDFNDTWESPSLEVIRGSGDRALSCQARELPSEQQITYNKEPYRSMIDFIFCSPALAADYVPGSYRIHAGSVASHGSDHNPVVAQFRLKRRSQ